MEIENAFWHSFAKFYRLWTFGSGQSNFEIQGIIKGRWIMKNLYNSKFILKIVTFIKKISVAPISAMCSRLSCHHCHKLPFHMVYIV
jgi:hypothetical protein